MKHFEKTKSLMKVFFYGLPVMVLILCFFSMTFIKEDLVSIDLKKIIQNTQDVKISDYVNEIEYIPLEITAECPISIIRKLYLTDKQIIIRSGNDIFLFDRKTGKFIRKIGTIGSGPQEYMSPLDCFYNSNDRVYTYGSMKSVIKIYDLDGKFIESFKTPVIDEVSTNKNLPIDAFFNTSTFIGYQ
jgi:hypothetical protein